MQLAINHLSFYCSRARRKDVLAKCYGEHFQKAQTAREAKRTEAHEADWLSQEFERRSWLFSKLTVEGILWNRFKQSFQPAHLKQVFLHILVLLRQELHSRLMLNPAYGYWPVSAMACIALWLELAEQVLRIQKWFSVAGIHYGGDKTAGLLLKYSCNRA